MPKKIFAAIFIVLIAGGAFFYLNHVEKVQAERSTSLKLFGNVDVREVTLAFRHSDRISEIFVEEGDLVKQGQLLARLDNRELQLTAEKARSQIKIQEAVLLRLKNGTRPEDLAKIQAQFNAAEKILLDARQHYNRIQKVYDETAGSAITRDELTSARLNYENKAAQLEQTQQSLNLARQEFLLTQYELFSPTDGIIRSKLLEIGDMASQSAPIFKISLNDKK